MKKRYKHALKICIALFLVAVGLLVAANRIEDRTALSNALAMWAITVSVLGIGSFAYLWKCPYCGAAPSKKHLSIPERCMECGAKLGK